VSIVPDEPEPSSGPVAGIGLLEDLATQISRFLVLPENGDLIIAVWVLFAHCYEVFSHAPYLAVTSAVKGCGKSTVLDVVEHLVPKALKAEGFSAAAIYRVIEKESPVLLIDELDSFVKRDEKLRGVLNSGYQRGGKYVCVVGDDHEPKAFRTWCPKLLAMIGDLPATLDDRSIHIRMDRKLECDETEGLEPTHHPMLLELKRRCMRWALDNATRLEDAVPVTGPFQNRQADRWRPLFAIADAVGGPWPDMLRGAAVSLEQRSERSYAIDLLSDIRTIFDAGDAPVIGSEALVSRLIEDREKPWCEWLKGKPMTPLALSRMLSPFGISTQKRRLGTINPIATYARHDFEPAWRRYVRPCSSTRANSEVHPEHTEREIRLVPDVPGVPPQIRGETLSLFTESV
jgi:putative DNA primase/helicase